MQMPSNADIRMPKMNKMNEMNKVNKKEAFIVEKLYKIGRLFVSAS